MVGQIAYLTIVLKLTKHHAATLQHITLLLLYAH